MRFLVEITSLRMFPGKNEYHLIMMLVFYLQLTIIFSFMARILKNVTSIGYLDLSNKTLAIKILTMILAAIGQVVI